MSWVELTGPVGAGKSALVPCIERAFRDGRAINTCRFTPGRSAALLAHFARSHPRLVFYAARAVAELPLTLRHRAAIARLVVRLALADQALRPAGRPGALIVDEGWTHRAVNLFAWHRVVNEPRVQAYIASIPRPDLVIVVDAPSHVIRTRLSDRGLPKRLRGRSPREVDAFLDRSRAVVELVADRLQSAEVPVVRFTNVGTLDSAADVLRTMLPAHLVTATGQVA